MRRAATIAFAILPALLVHGIWIKASVAPDLFSWSGDGRFVSVSVGASGIYVGHYRQSRWMAGGFGHSTFDEQHYEEIFRTTSWFLGFGYVGGKGDSTAIGYRFDVVRIRFWFPSCLSLILLLLVIARCYRDRARRNNSLCVNCGYDLRATPGRCPECGHVPDSPPNAP